MKVEDVALKKVKYNYGVNGLSIDSRTIKKGDIFFCIDGSNHNGENFIDEVIDKKIKTIVTGNKQYFNNENQEKELKKGTNFRIYEEKFKNDKINFIYSDDVKRDLALYAKRFYNDISKKVCLVGVTGTNGKTTITTLLYKYYRYLGRNVTLIGTNGVYINDEFYSTNNTTPDIITIYEYIKKSIENNIHLVIMEVSSIGIKEARVLGLDFDIVLLTNVTLDHLDYHKTFDDYLYTKLFFLNNSKVIITNKDDPSYRILSRMCEKKIITYGKDNADYNLINMETSLDNSYFSFCVKDLKYQITTSLLGEYNIYNALGFISIIDNLDSFNKYTVNFLQKKITIDGRFEVVNTKRGTFVIDFAHTPDGVSKILDLLNNLKRGKLITVIGMGGNRDRSKRKIVGGILDDKSDVVILTSDNSRDENPNNIINEICKGIRCKDLNKDLFIEVNREKAIEKAFRISTVNDIVALLGKGNEGHIIINGRYIPFKDKEEVIKIANKLGNKI